MAYRIEKYGSRFWAVYDEQNLLIVVTLYKKGAAEVVRRLTALTTAASVS